MKKELKLTKEQLEDLYLKQKLSSLEIAKKLNIKHSKFIRRKLKKFDIPIRSLSEALTKKFKAPFNEDLIEKAFFLGLRLGDFHAKKVRLCYRMQTSSTHPAQISLLKESFKNYGETKTYLYNNKLRGPQWFMYVDLHPSFSFLLEKPKELPKWILENDDCFYNFLSAYSDCEGNWHFSKSHGKHLRVTFRIRANDKIILEQIKNKLENISLNPLLNLERKKGEETPYGKFNFDIYSLVLNQKKDVNYLVNKILPHSRHIEKIKKMNFILENKGKTWNEIEPALNRIKEEIKKEKLQKQR